MKNGATKEEFLDYLIFFSLFLCFQIFLVFVFNLLIVASRLTHNILLRHATWSDRGVDVTLAHKSTSLNTTEPLLRFAVGCTQIEI